MLKDHYNDRLLSQYLPPAGYFIFYIAKPSYKLRGDCQVGPRFPVLALFINHNVFHPPPSHLVAQVAAGRYPSTPHPHTHTHTRFMLCDLYIAFTEDAFSSALLESANPHEWFVLQPVSSV